MALFFAARRWARGQHLVQSLAWLFREPRGQRRTTYRPHLEALEDRRTPSITPGNEVLLTNNVTAVAAAADGHFVTVLNNLAQIYNADASPRSGVFQVSPDSGTLVAADAQGNFVAVWADTTGTTSATVYARLFDASGQPLGAQFQVDQEATGRQESPAVAMNASGAFVITWESFGEAGNTPGIYARQFSPAGVALGNEFLVSPMINTLTSVAMDAAGDFVVAWVDANDNIYARLYNAAGTAVTGAFQVNQGTTQNGTPQVAMDAQGDFVVVWDGDNGVSARRFNATGVAQGDQFVVNKFTYPTNAGLITNSQVAMDPQGDFVVTWQSVGTFDQHRGFGPSEEGAGPGIYARLFSASGQDLTSEFQVNQSLGVVPLAFAPLVVMDAQGDFTVISPVGGSFARRYIEGTTGYSFDPATQTLTLSTGSSNNAFTFTQASQIGPDGISVLTNYSFTLNGVTQTYNSVAFSQAHVIALDAGNTAVLVTNDTYVDSNGFSQETAELALLNFVGGSIYRVDAGGTHNLLSFTDFQSMYAYLGQADSGQLIGSGANNLVVTAGSYSYMSTVLTGYSLFSLISGGANVYAYASPYRDAQVWHYDTNAMDSFVASGNAYSYMSGTDNGHAFFNVAVGFNTTYAFSQYGKSIAYLIDSPGNDTFYGTSGYSYVSGTNSGQSFFNEAQGFALVYGESFNGGTDFAYNLDPRHNILSGNWILLT
jgi:hypothetical protein